MRKRFYIPHQFLNEWWRMSVRYEEYLPEMQMAFDSVVATPAEAAAILRELEEMARARSVEKCVPKAHHDTVTVLEW